MPIVAMARSSSFPGGPTAASWPPRRAGRTAHTRTGGRAGAERRAGGDGFVAAQEAAGPSREESQRRRLRLEAAGEALKPARSGAADEAVVGRRGVGEMDRSGDGCPQGGGSGCRAGVERFGSCPSIVRGVDSKRSTTWRVVDHVELGVGCVGGRSRASCRRTPGTGSTAGARLRRKMGGAVLPAVLETSGDRSLVRDRRPKGRPYQIADALGSDRQRALAGSGCYSYDSHMRTISSIARQEPLRAAARGGAASAGDRDQEGPASGDRPLGRGHQRIRGTAWQRLVDAMATARKEAAGRGLTDERLDELLADES